ncbi:MAG TPA: type II toxin-antitoxin system death-on-curing family toxin [Atopostipes sp.]|nr:type II toxin-antitoxin system death-on-curing family toxin [Atopostipes sp.]
MRYLKKEEIIYFNEKTLSTNTPNEIIRIREPGALEMLVNAPKGKLFGRELYPTIYDKAAILMINISTKHVFHNGNKGTAFISLEIFMELNGYESNMAFQ